jgi:G3E family GTPase
VLGGFLGSGKTTALLSLARFLVNRCEKRENAVMILENEIGEVGVDDKTVAAAGLNVTNLFAGCVCCTASGELTVAAQRILREYDPEWLIIETTGIAYPREIRANLGSALGLEPRILVIADAVRWKRLYRAMNVLLAGQLESADAVLLNKCDAASPDAVAGAEAQIGTLNGAIPLFRVSAADGIADEVWETATGCGL